MRKWSQRVYSSMKSLRSWNIKPNSNEYLSLFRKYVLVIKNIMCIKKWTSMNYHKMKITILFQQVK